MGGCRPHRRRARGGRRAIRAVGGSATLVRSISRMLRHCAARRRRLTSATVGSTCWSGNAGVLGPLSPLVMWSRSLGRCAAVNVTANWQLIRAHGIRSCGCRAPDAWCSSPRASWRIRAPIGGPMRLQSGARDARAHLRGETVSDPCAGQSVQSGRDPAPALRATGDAGEDPTELKTPEPDRRADPRIVSPQFRKPGSCLIIARARMRRATASPTPLPSRESGVSPAPMAGPNFSTDQQIHCPRPRLNRSWRTTLDVGGRSASAASRPSWGASGRRRQMVASCVLAFRKTTL